MTIKKSFNSQIDCIHYARAPEKKTHSSASANINEAQTTMKMDLPVIMIEEQTNWTDDWTQKNESLNAILAEKKETNL